MITPDISANPATFTSIHNKQWFKYALFISLLIHLSAVVFIWAAAIKTSEKRPVNSFIIGDLTPLPGQHQTATTVNRPTLSRQTNQIKPEALSKKTEDGNFSDKGREDQPIQSATKNRQVSTEALVLGMAHGYISSIADGNTLHADIRGYYFELVNSINHQWWLLAKELKKPVRKDGLVELIILQDGTLGSQRVRQSTGSKEADLLLIKAIQTAAPFSPLPAGFNQKTFTAPLRIKAPSHLLGSDSEQATYSRKQL